MNLIRTDDVHAQVRRRLLAMMETGAEAKARDLLVEYAAEYPEQAAKARDDISSAYGKFL